MFIYALLCQRYLTNNLNGCILPVSELIKRLVATVRAEDHRSLTINKNFSYVLAVNTLTARYIPGIPVP